MTVSTEPIAISPAKSASGVTPTVTRRAEPAWDIALLFPNQGHWSEEDYLSLDSSRLVEYSFGNIEVVEMATQTHQDIVAFLYAALLFVVQANKLGKVNFAPLPVKLFDGKFREPDVLFMSAKHADRRRNDYWIGADLVMEVVSDNDRRRDIETKRREYAQSGIPEYWIVDPLKKEVTVLTLAGTQYGVAGVYQVGDRAMSVVLPGFEAEVAEIFAAK